MNNFCFRVRTVLHVSLFCVFSSLTDSCITLKSEIPFGEPRSRAALKMSVPGADSCSVSEDTEPHLYISGVLVDSTYDWRRDTLYGAYGCTLYLLRDFEPVVCFPASEVTSSSPDPDLSHIICGKLYTERCSSSGTSVACNGNTLYKCPEREILVGILETDGSVWTLSRSRSYEGFTLRCDGTIMFKRTDALPFGDFDTPESPALYLSDSSICFAYRTTSSGKETVYFVEDLQESLISTSTSITTLDARFLDGQQCVCYNEDMLTTLRYGTKSMDISDHGTIQWMNGTIVKYQGKPAFAGHYQYSNSITTFSGICGFCPLLQLSDTEDYIYVRGSYVTSLPQSLVPDSYSLFSRRCAVLCGTTLYMALSPSTYDEIPAFWDGKDLLPIPGINYLTDIQLF